MEETMTMMPVWAEIMIGIAGAFGGIELLRFLYELVFHKAAKKKADAEAAQQTAEANSADTDYRKSEMELIKEQMDFNKQQLAGLREEYKELEEEKRTLKDDYRSLKANYRHLGDAADALYKEFQRAFRAEVEKKKDAEQHYCGNANCKKRVPVHYETVTSEEPDFDLEALKNFTRVTSEDVSADADDEAVPKIVKPKPQLKEEEIKEVRDGEL